MDSDWATVGIEPTQDRRTLRRAYAAQLKLHSPETDPEGFQRLREAYERLLQALDAEPVAPTPGVPAALSPELHTMEAASKEPPAGFDPQNVPSAVPEASEHLGSKPLDAIKAALERSDDDAIECLQRLLFGAEPLPLDAEEALTAALVQYLFDPEIAARHFSFLIAFVQMTRISERALADEQYAAFFEQVQQWVDQYNEERAQHARDLREQAFEQVSKRVSSLLELRRECLELGKPLDRSMHARFMEYIEAFETEDNAQWFYMFRDQLVKSLEQLCTGPRLPRFEQAVTEKLGLDPAERFKSPYKSQIDLLESRRRGYAKRIDIEAKLKRAESTQGSIELEVSSLLLQSVASLAHKSKLGSAQRNALAREVYAIDKAAPGFWTFERGPEVYAQLCRLGGGPSPQTRERIRGFLRRLGYRNFVAPLVALAGVALSCLLFWLFPSYWLLGLVLAATAAGWWRYRCCP